MRNIAMYNRLAPTRQLEVFHDINARQIRMGNSPMTWNEWTSMDPGVRHALLEDNEHFSNVLSLIYTKMLQRTKRISGTECKRYALAWIEQELRGYRICDNFKLSGADIVKVRRILDPYWQL